jgi:hypothetical protein
MEIGGAIIALPIFFIVFETTKTPGGLPKRKCILQEGESQTDLVAANRLQTVS